MHMRLICIFYFYSTQKMVKKDDVDITQEIDDVLESDVSEREESEEKSSSIETSNNEEGRKTKKTKTVDDDSVMGKLLQSSDVKIPAEGEKLKGKVIEIDSLATYLDLGVFGSGIVYGKEVKEGFGANRKKLQIGDEITAVILDLENEDGYVELSVREAMLEEAWKDIEKKKESRDVINVKIIDANKGGLMLEVNSITGFMPVSQLTPEHYPRVEDGDKNKILEILRTYIGEEISVCVIDYDQEEEKLIVSEKEANKGRERDAVSELKVGDIVEGEASGVVDFGAFVKFFPPSKAEEGDENDKLEGLVHISQLDWQLIDDPRKVVKVGDKIKAKIISIDDTRISLSVRELKNDPWAGVAEKYKVGDEVQGTVNKINHFGAFVYLDKDIHGLAHVSGFSGYPKKALDEIIEIEKEYCWEIMSMEPNSHRMGLKFLGAVSAKASKKDDKKDEDKKAEKKSSSAKTSKDKEDKKTVKAKVKKKAAPKKEAKKSEEKVEKKTAKKAVKKPAKKTTKKTSDKKPAKKETRKKVKKAEKKDK